MQENDFHQEHYFLNDQKIYKFLFDNKNTIECTFYNHNVIFEISDLLSKTTREISEILLKDVHKNTKFLDKIFVQEKDFMRIISWLEPLNYYRYQKYLYNIFIFIDEDLLKLTQIYLKTYISYYEN